MNNTKRLFIAAAAAQLASVTFIRAEVIAATNFDGRTLTEVNVPEDTATGLNWTINGVQDPGNMTSLNADGNGLRLFDAQPDVQDLFAPGINTGNGNTFWTTSVSLTILPGSSVTVTDITFDYWAISGGQVQNVNRRSDFTLTILDPSGNPVASVDVLDPVSGTGVGVPSVTATFEAPVPLTAPGTYTLGIKGGDYAGDDETGNHTAIDNLSINGVLGGGSGFTITEIVFNPGSNRLSLTWNSSPGATYAVKYSTDLLDWDADLDDGIPAAEGKRTTVVFDLSETELANLEKAFFRVEVQPGG
ncbi:MAG: hypothetical protein ACJAQT_004829 [Akkermansiaceae bacterium]|jgi:hypothetical protein